MKFAILSLWLAEHQMNLKFKEVFGRCNPALPLNNSGNVVRVMRCKKIGKMFVLYLITPRYLYLEIHLTWGLAYNLTKQKEDIAHVFFGIEGYKSIDLIASWFYKAARYIAEQAHALHSYLPTLFARVSKWGFYGQYF
nr:DNA methyltransferase [Pseudomonas gessardii]